jgi:hypothetical protein
MLQYSSRQKFTSTGRGPPFPSSRAYDIRFGLGDYYGGLHCGDALEVFTGRKWKPTRIEYGANWYLVGIRAEDLSGLRVRI